MDVITHDDLSGAKHGFFTRSGGVSQGIYQGLNCGLGSDDETEAVTLNRARVADWISVAPSHLLTVHQIHSPDVIAVTDPFPGAAPKVDGMVTKTRGLALGALSADCQPVLFHDPVAQVIGAAHAGWRGALAGVLNSVVAQMEALGATRSNIRAVIGPCISQTAYEVGPEFVDSFLQNDPRFDRFFTQSEGDRMLFDLPRFGLHCLVQAGVEHSSWTGDCTYTDAERFYSYRRSTQRNEPDYGRLISAISLL